MTRIVKRKRKVAPISRKRIRIVPSRHVPDVEPEPIEYPTTPDEDPIISFGTVTDSRIADSYDLGLEYPDGEYRGPPVRSRPARLIPDIGTDDAAGFYSQERLTDALRRWVSGKNEIAGISSVDMPNIGTYEITIFGFGSATRIDSIVIRFRIWRARELLDALESLDTVPSIYVRARNNGLGIPEDEIRFRMNYGDRSSN